MDVIALALAIAAIVVFLFSDTRYGLALLTAALICQYGSVADNVINF